MDSAGNSRKSYSREKKLEILDYAKNHNVFQAAKMYSINECNIRRWKISMKDIIEAPRGTRSFRGKAPTLPILEEKLYRLFQERKKNGQKTTEKWFILKAKKLHDKSGSKEVCSFTRGWFRGFSNRKNLSRRVPTQKGSKSVEDKVPFIRDFHHRLRQTITKIGGVQSSQVANCDQTPMPFAFWGGKTFADKGDKQVWVKTLKSGEEKRFCTVHLTVFADGKPRVKPLVIFRGSGKRIKNVEKNQYHAKVKVEFQKDAWCDEAQFGIYVKSQLARFKEPGALLLTLDSHKAQKTENMKELMVSKHIYPVYVSPGCTGEIQVLDVAFNHEFKTLVAESFDEFMELNFERLQKQNISASERRILVTKWIGTAWNRMHGQNGREANDTVVNAFEFTGVMLPVDGSQDHKIKIPGLESYSVGKRLSETLPVNKQFALISEDDSEFQDSDEEGDSSGDGDSDYSVRNDSGMESDSDVPCSVAGPSTRRRRRVITSDDSDDEAEVSGQGSLPSCSIERIESGPGLL